MDQIPWSAFFFTLCRQVEKTRSFLIYKNSDEVIKTSHVQVHFSGSPLRFYLRISFFFFGVSSDTVLEVFLVVRIGSMQCKNATPTAEKGGRFPGMFQYFGSYEMARN